MAILLLISSNQENIPYNNIGDVVGVFEDDHPFTPNELSRFEFLTITGSRADVEARLNQLRVTKTQVFYDTSINEYTFTQPASENLDHSITVWSTMEPPGIWYKLEEDDKYPFFVTDLSQAEKDFIADPGFDITSPTVDAYISKLGKQLDRKTENTTEITELRGLTPF